MTAPVAPVVLLEHPADGVALIRLNRPDARNALNMEVRHLLAKHVAEVTEDPAVRVIIFTGGEKVFAAGADIKEMAEAGSIEMMQRGALKLWRAAAASHTSRSKPCSPAMSQVSPRTANAFRWRAVGLSMRSSAACQVRPASLLSNARL